MRSRVVNAFCTFSLSGQRVLENISVLLQGLTYDLLLLSFYLHLRLQQGTWRVTS